MLMNLERITEKVGKYKKVAIAVGIIIVLSIPYSIGSSTAKTELNGEKLKYEDIAKEIESAKKEIKKYKAEVEDVEAKVKSVNDEYAKSQSEFDEAKKISSQKDTILAEIAKVSGELNSKKNELTILDTNITSKRNEIASLDQVIKEKQEAPVMLPAGQFVAGKDIPIGRYKIVPVGDGSNIAIYDSNGDILYHTIISSRPNHGVPEYVTSLLPDYKIDASAPFKYIPVE
jgi:predicted RNase H-like nuclease (RuvC/YqgF family)